jgi:hypothetical protein
MIKNYLGKDKITIKRENKNLSYLFIYYKK